MTDCFHHSFWRVSTRFVDSSNSVDSMELFLFDISECVMRFGRNSTITSLYQLYNLNNLF